MEEKSKLGTLPKNNNTIQNLPKRYDTVQKIRFGKIENTIRGKSKLENFTKKITTQFKINQNSTTRCKKSDSGKSKTQYEENRS
jgi:hypothetical protein